jgi:hypothetical protein
VVSTQSTTRYRNSIFFFFFFFVPEKNRNAVFVEGRSVKWNSSQGQARLIGQMYKREPATLRLVNGGEETGG